MATVKFSNGATVTFNGTPTPADINQVAQTPAVKNYKGATSFSSNSIQDTPGAAQDLITKGIPNLLNSVATPFESVAAAPVQGLARLIGAKDPYAQGMPNFNSLGSSAAETAASPTANNPIAPFTKQGLITKAGQAGEIATSAIAPEQAGIIKLGLLGGLSGFSQALASGERDPAKLLEASGSGAAFGGGLGIAGKAISKSGNLLRNLSGVNPQVMNELKNAPVDLINTYADNAIAHESDIRAPTAHATAENAAQGRAKILVTKVIPQAGKAVGEARAAAGALPIQVNAGAASIPGAPAAQTLYSDIGNKVGEMTGYGFGNAGDVETGLPGLSGTKGPSIPILQQLPGRSVDLSKADEDRLQTLQGYLLHLQNNPNVQTASDLVHNLYQQVDYSRPQFGAGQSPVDGALKYAAHAINQSISGASPELAAANANYESLMDLKRQVAGEAGNDFQHASLMMRRVLSGDKSAGAIGALDGLTKATQPFVTGASADKTDLVTHAVLADWATSNFGGPSAKTLMNQYENEGASLFGYASRIVKTIAKESVSALSPDPLKYAQAIASGQPYSLNPIARLTQNVLDSAEGKLFSKAIAQKAKVGINAAESIAENLIKMAVFHSLTGPSTPPQDTGQGQISQVVPASPAAPGQGALPQQTPVPQASQSNSRSLSSGVNQASSTALKGLTAPLTGQAMSANLRAGSRGLSLS